MSINFTVYTFYFRPNIFLSVSNKGADVRKDLQSQMIQQGNKFQFEGPTIIYCPTKKITDHIATVVNGKSALFKTPHYAYSVPFLLNYTPHKTEF